MKFEREDAEFLQSALADKDIDSKVTSKGLMVPKESLSKAKALVKKMGYDVPVMGGLHEGVELPTFQEFVKLRMEACDNEDSDDEDEDDDSDSDEDDEMDEGKKKK